MLGHKLLSDRVLGLAICKHFGIDTAKHAVDSDFEINTEPGEPVTVKLTLMLTSDDLAGIARAAMHLERWDLEGLGSFNGGSVDAGPAR